MQKLLSVCLLITSLSVTAQVPDTSFTKAGVIASANLYKQSIRGQTFIYTGSEYRPPRQTNDEEHPFFEADDWVFGDIVYDKKYFDNIPLMYDVTTDRVVTENYYSGQQIALVSEKISNFSFGRHLFVRETHKTLPKVGFYELLYAGQSRTLARRQKISRETISSQKLEIKFDSKSRFFILKNGNYFPVKSKGSVIQLFEDEKQAIKSFIKKNKLKFNEPSSALAAVAAYYDQLKNQK